MNNDHCYSEFEHEVIADIRAKYPKLSRPVIIKTLIEKFWADKGITPV
jgi:hypothetical protein